MAMTTVFSASSGWPTTSEATAGTTMNAASSTGPISWGRSNQGRRRIALAIAHVSTAAPTMATAATTFSVRLHSDRSRA